MLCPGSVGSVLLLDLTDELDQAAKAAASDHYRYIPSIAIKEEG
jgi:hypothetical protein